MKPYDEEEDFHKKDKKKGRRERKRLQEKDRSKYKKTDSLKRRNESSYDDAPIGTVLSITGEGSLVDSKTGVYLCSLSGLLKKEKNQSKNLIAVGDVVSFNISSPREGRIIHVHPRRTILSRIDVSGKKEQLIAVNVDLAVICASTTSPPLKPALIDRYLIAARKGKMHPIILINKVDLEKAPPLFLTAYKKLQFQVLEISTITGEGIEMLKELLQNKTAVFSGQSGVGKSSILNRAFGLSLKTGTISLRTDKGAHTTSKAELLPLPNGGYCVDTPGIRSFGLWSLTKEDVLNHFTEFESRRRKPCRYPSCSHTNEPDCSVLRAVKRGTIPLMRYESYLSLLKEALQTNKKTTWS